MNNKIRTIDQQRSEFALDWVLNNKKVKKIKNLSSGVPAIILKNGLGQTLAFFAQKVNSNKAEYQVLFGAIVVWLNQRQLINCTKSEAVLELISKKDQWKYIEIQTEVIRLMEWVKRYANAFIEDENKGD